MNESKATASYNHSAEISIDKEVASLVEDFEIDKKLANIKNQLLSLSKFNENIKLKQAAATSVSSGGSYSSVNVSAYESITSPAGKPPPSHNI